MVDLVRSAYRAAIGTPSLDYHYFFSTPLFSAYREQLANYIEREVGDHPGLANLSVVQSVRKGLDSPEAYKGFVNELRKLVKSKGSLDGESAAFVERLCCWIYTGPQLMPQMIEWLQKQLTPTEKARLADGPIHSTIQDLHARLGKEPQFKGDVFQDYRPYDPRFLGDTPSHFFKVYSTQIIRTPAITRDEKRSFFGHLTESAVVEEFQGFLDGYRRDGKTHLYVNLMAPHGSEGLRTKAIADLEVANPDQLQLMNLSKDCPFYHQTGKFLSQNNAIEFKRSFCAELFENKEYFRWPTSWDRARTKTLVERAIDDVHQNQYQSKSNLSLEERRSFIELAYTEIITAMLSQFKPTSCNLSCRSCIDRGAANLALLYAKTEPGLSNETLATIALAPAMIAQSRPMLGHRMERLVPALGVICNKK
jgi:hypothetical protein